MLLKEYLSNLANRIHDCADTGILLSSEITTDFRTEKIGLIEGRLAFSDESTLYFKEYLDLRYGVTKQTYAFHYQDQNAGLRFRYDNASHKPNLGYQHHKHTAQGITSTTIPTLQEVLEEIITTYFEL